MFKGKEYALKTLERETLLKRDKVPAVLREKDLLNDNIRSFKPCPFVLKLHHTFSDTDCLYFVMEYLRGGTLENFLATYSKRMTDELIKFMVAQLVLVLEYL